MLHRTSDKQSPCRLLISNYPWYYHKTL